MLTIQFSHICFVTDHYVVCILCDEVHGCYMDPSALPVYNGGYYDVIVVHRADKNRIRLIYLSN